MQTPRFSLLVTLLLSLIVPLGARAQDVSSGSFAGVIRDASGAVLPGVTVEAASPALIEKVRATVSDGEGRYRIPGLRPGTYSVTFTLPGFKTVRRDGIELTTGFIATVNAELSVGAVEETITVSGETPIEPTLSLHNAFNANSILLMNLRYGPAWQNVQGVLPPRMIKLGVSVDF